MSDEKIYLDEPKWLGFFNEDCGDKLVIHDRDGWFGISLCDGNVDSYGDMNISHETARKIAHWLLARADEMEGKR